MHVIYQLLFKLNMLFLYTDELTTLSLSVAAKITIGQVDSENEP